MLLSIGESMKKKTKTILIIILLLIIICLVFILTTIAFKSNEKEDDISNATAFKCQTKYLKTPDGPYNSIGYIRYYSFHIVEDNKIELDGFEDLIYFKNKEDTLNYYNILKEHPDFNQKSLNGKYDLEKHTVSILALYPVPGLIEIYDDTYFPYLKSIGYTCKAIK